MGCPASFGAGSIQATLPSHAVTSSLAKMWLFEAGLLMRMSTTLRSRGKCSFHPQRATNIPADQWWSEVPLLGRGREHTSLPNTERSNVARKCAGAREAACRGGAEAGGALSSQRDR